MKHKLKFHLNSVLIAIIDTVFTIGTDMVAGALLSKAYITSFMPNISNSILLKY